MVCTDRQLVQSQLEQGFSTRIGVQKAIRPFTGEPAGSNLVDYINREVYPAVKQLRSGHNEIYLKAKENSPSSNPLAYFFSPNTVNADPTTGFLRLDSATQNTATTIRVSENNGSRKNVATWLSVMAGGSTTPLGVVTLQHQSDPGRFVRFNLTSMTDQGAYWDLGVTPVESSHPNPFADSDPIQIGFIAGVASGGVSLASTVSAIRAVSIVTLAGSQSASFSNATNSFITGGTLFLNEAATSLNSSLSIGNVIFRASGNTLLGAARIGFIAGTRNQPAQSVSFQDINNVTWSLNFNTFAGFGVVPAVFFNYAAPRAVSAGTQLGASSGTLAFADSNGVSWGMSGSSQITATVAPQLGLLSHVGGNSVTNATRLAFSNASNVTFSLSTAASAATLLASVASSLTNINVSAGTTSNLLSAITFSNGSGVSFGLNASVITASVATSLTAVNISAGTTSNNLSALTFANGSGVTWGLNASTLTASVNDQSIGLVSHIGGNQVSSVSRLAFSNASNVTWSLSTAANAATVIASVAAGGGAGMAISAGTQSVSTGTVLFLDSNNLTFGMSGSSRVTASFALNLSAGTTSNNLSGLTFQNSNNISFGLNAGVVTGSFATTFIGGIAGGTQTATSGTIVFSNSNDVSFGLSGSTRMTASYLPQIGLVSHIGGNQVSSVTRLAFSNDSNVTWSLSTAANAATVIASVGAGGGGGIGGIAAATDNTGGRSTLTSGTVLFRRADTQLTANFQSLNVANVQFTLDTGAGTTQMLAFAGFNATVNRDATDTGGFFASKFQMSDGGGIKWGVSTTSNADGKEILFGASLPTLNWYLNAGQGSQLVANNLGGLTASLWLSPFAYTLGGNITANTMEFLIQGAGFTSTQSTASYAWTVRGGVYTLANSTQLSLVNSFLASSSATTESFSARNNLISGDRWLTIGTARWSSSPVFSAGVNYWIGVVNQTAGAVNIPGFFQAQRYMQAIAGAYRGNLGASHSSNSSFGIVPFCGGVNTTAIPTTIGTAGLVNYSNFNMLPIFAMRNNVARIT